MISLLAQKRICTEFVAYKDHAFARELYNNVVVKLCFNQVQDSKIILDGQYLKPFHESDQDYKDLSMEFINKSKIVTTQCQSKIALTYFLELLTSEYSRDPKQRNICDLICKI